MTIRFWRMALLGVICVGMASCTRGDKSIKPGFDSGAGQRSNIGTGQGSLDADDLGPDLASAGTMRGQLESDRRLQPVYFDYNSAALRPDTQAALDDYAGYLEGDPGMRVQIEGHCDERGTLEYNLALGERRAQTVRKYLVRQGVDPDRLYTLSYGEEKPARQGHSESAWRFNRRAEFKVAR